VIYEMYSASRLYRHLDSPGGFKRLRGGLTISERNWRGCLRGLSNSGKKETGAKIFSENICAGPRIKFYSKQVREKRYSAQKRMRITECLRYYKR